MPMQWVSATILYGATTRARVYQETLNLSLAEIKGDKTRRRMASEQQINRLPVLHRSVLPTRSPVHPPHQQAEAATNSHHL